MAYGLALTPLCTWENVNQVSKAAHRPARLPASARAVSPQKNAVRREHASDGSRSAISEGPSVETLAHVEK